MWLLATNNSSLRTHIESVHKEKKFPCEACDYLATDKSILSTHIKSVHEGKMFPWELLAYLAS